MEEQSTEGADFQELELHEVITRGLLDFDEWTSLISEVEKTYRENIEKICLVYESFLSEFPLCYGYWRKYAYHKIRLCGVDDVIEVFERAVHSATFSVDVWVDYCSFGISAFEDPSDVHRLFKRGLSFIGKDYLSHVLWDKYIEYEFSRQQWSSLALIYIQTLEFPTKKLHNYYESFKNFASILEEEMKSHANSTLDAQSEPASDDESYRFYKLGDVMHAIEVMLNLPFGTTTYKALRKYISYGEKFYHEACQLDDKISLFETNIRRSYFHIKPLDVNQLENWHNYLDFIEVQGDFDWAVKLYERCLIPCANYPEFWMRYAEFMESKGGREAANFSLERATQTFVKRVPVIHLFSARYKEYIGDLFGARAALLKCDQESDTEFVQNVVIKANMERRQGNFTEASNVFKEALKLAESKEKSHASILYVHFSRLQHMITDSADAARDVLIEGIKHLPTSKLLLEELIKLSMMNGGSRHINEVDHIIANSIYLTSGTSQSLSAKDAEDVSNLYLEFVDLCGSVQDVMKAWHQHIKLFPHCARRAPCKHPGASVKPWKLVTEARKETPSTLPPQLSEDSGHQIQSPLQEEKLSSSGNHISLSGADATSQIFDQNTHILENHELSFEASAVDPRQSEECENDVQGTVEPVCTKSSEQPQEDAPEPNMLTLESAPVTNDSQILQSSQEYFEKGIMEAKHDIEPEQDWRPPSLDKLCLDSQSDKSQDLIPKESDECEADVETSFPNGRVLKSESPRGNSKSNESLLEISHHSSGDHFVSCPISACIADSPKSRSEIFCHSSVYQSAALEAHSLPQMQANSAGNWHQRSKHERSRKDSRYGFHGHSHRRRRFHHQQQLSPQNQYQRAEMGTQIPVGQNQMSQVLNPQHTQVQYGSQALIAPTVSTKAASSQAWSVQDVQHQNFAAANHSQPQAQPAAFPLAHMVLHTTQSGEQQGDLQNNQAYNQMWQYYYYQQQQQLLMQQQPPQQQQLLQQQYLQQQLQIQQQYLQQQQLQQQLSGEQHPQLQQQDQQQPLQMQQQLQFMQQQQQWQLQYQQQFLQQQYPYQLQQQQHMLYLQQQQLQFQQSSGQLLQNHLHHQQQQEELSEQQQLRQQCEENGTSCEHISTSQSNSCKQEAMAEARQHAESQGPGAATPPQSLGFLGDPCVVSTSKESHSPQNP